MGSKEADLQGLLQVWVILFLLGGLLGICIGVNPCSPGHGTCQDKILVITMQCSIGCNKGQHAGLSSGLMLNWLADSKSSMQTMW